MYLPLCRKQVQTIRTYKMNYRNYVDRFYVLLKYQAVNSINPPQIPKCYMNSEYHCGGQNR